MGTRQNPTEYRTRSGCRRCRERRIKCPEQRPRCKTCELRGDACSYDLVLRWGRVQTCTDVRAWHKPAFTSSGMFLNVGSCYFASSKGDLCGANDQSIWKGQNDMDAVLPMEYVHFDAQDPQAAHGISHSPSYFHLSAIESHLWDYFHKEITPACVLNPNTNPYQDVMLKVAASSGTSSPIFHGVMSISANQLYSLGHHKYQHLVWKHRHHALQGLRFETLKHQNGQANILSAAQMAATALALCFVEISHDCSASWVSHTNFTRSLVQTFSHHSSDADVEALFNFAGAYIISHEIFAHTAWIPSEEQDYAVMNLSDDTNLQTLTGCSTEFLQILSDINQLALEIRSHSDSIHPDNEIETDLNKRIRDLERKLHAWNKGQAVDPHSDTPESVLVAETKRLTGLLYLYSRTSNLGPQDSCIMRLTSRILGLISKITLRTNTVLWPLFMVATLGVRPESDSDRAMVLEKLHLLQGTRQLGSVKKARHIIENVWNTRDLRESASNMGWRVLELASSSDKISLA